MKILYVEDALVNLCLIERIARMHHHDVINYTYAELALQNFAKDAPDLVLIDIRLDGAMNGIDLIRMLRGTGVTQPLVVITAVADDEVRRECIEAGATQFLIKPVQVRDMLRLLQKYAAALSGPGDSAGLPGVGDTPGLPGAGDAAAAGAM